MAIYEVTREYLEKFVDEIISKNTDFKEFREDLIDVLTYNGCDSADFVEQDSQNEDSWPYEKKEPTQLYIRDSRYHIRIKDIAVDFLENVLTGALLDGVLAWFGKSSGAELSLIGISKDFICFIKRVLKEYVIKLDNTEFCVYLQIISHLREHTEFSIRDMKDWMPVDCSSRCNMPTDKWECPDFENGFCSFTRNRNLKAVLDKLVSKSIIDYGENDTYKIRY